MPNRIHIFKIWVEEILNNRQLCKERSVKMKQRKLLWRFLLFFQTLRPRKVILDSVLVSTRSTVLQLLLNITISGAVSWFRRSVGDLSIWRAGFESTSVTVAFVERKGTGTEFSVTALVFPCQYHSTDAYLTHHWSCVIQATDIVVK
jgi:hypothetical protein